MATSDSEDFESADEDLEASGDKNQENKSKHDVKKKHIHCNKTMEKSHEIISSEEKCDPVESDKNIHEGVVDTLVKSEEPDHDSFNSKLKIAELPVTEKNDKEVAETELHKLEYQKIEKAIPNIQDESSKIKDKALEEETGGWEDDLGDLEDEVEEVVQEKENLIKPEYESVLDRLTGTSEKETSNSSGGWSSWGSWGVTSLLSTATESVSTLTSHVSQGLNTVLEAGLGAPSPEELARLDHEREQALVETQSKEETVAEPEIVEEEKTADSGGLFGFGRVMSGVTSITKLVETAGTKVVSGGLDTLETIGKKTMEVLQEGDPGLKKKRAFFNNKIQLSQILREAKEKAEKEDQEHKDKEEARKAHFETLFDDYQGLVHLEALEMLSKQCDLKLQSILLTSTGLALVQLQQALNDLKEQCQLPEEEDVEEPPVSKQRERLADIGKGLGVHVATDKLLKTWDETEQWLETCRVNFQSPAEGAEIPTSRKIHQKAMATLARLTAESVEQFHKAAELLLVLEERNPSQEANIFLDMTSVLCSQISTAATRFSECLNNSPENSLDHEAISALITNIFLEAAHSSSYIQEAFQLLVPVLQVGITVS